MRFFFFFIIIIFTVVVIMIIINIKKHIDRYIFIRLQLCRYTSLTTDIRNTFKIMFRINKFKFLDNVTLLFSQLCVHKWYLNTCKIITKLSCFYLCIPIHSTTPIIALGSMDISWTSRELTVYYENSLFCTLFPPQTYR